MWGGSKFTQMVDQSLDQHVNFVTRLSFFYTDFQCCRLRLFNDTDVAKFLHHIANMDPPHPAFNHSDHPSYRISTGEYTGRPAQTNVGSLAHVEHIPQTIAPAAQHTHASGMPYVVPWGEHQFQPKNETTFKEESDSHQHVVKVCYLLY